VHAQRREGETNLVAEAMFEDDGEHSL
jgi:hypothetical protein